MHAKQDDRFWEERAFGLFLRASQHDSDDHVRFQWPVVSPSTVSHAASIFSSGKSSLIGKRG